MTKWVVKDKRIWITGASTGIGAALSIALSKQGAWVAISARDENKLLLTAQQCEDSSRIMIMPCDVTDKNANFFAIEKIKAAWGELDMAIFNAGSCEYINSEDFRSEPFQRMINTNFISMTYGIEAALPLLRLSAQPYIVGMSSIAAYLGLPRSEAYSASKAAIRIMLQGLRLDLLKENIAVSIICPGFVKTPLTDKNDFAMPLRISAKNAALKIIKGLSKQQHEIHFPKLFTYLVKLMAFLPTRWTLAILKKLTRDTTKK